MKGERYRTSDEKRQAIIDLLPIADSLRDMARILGMPYATVSQIARPFIAVLKATGALDACPCGREKFHDRGCTRNSELSQASASLGKVDRRAAMIREIMTGDPYNVIGPRVDMTTKGVRGYLKFLTPAQRERRKALERGRLQGGPNCPTFRPTRDALYRQIAKAVPGWLDQHLHDDVISEIYLAILDGTIAQADVTANAERFARAARNAFASKWGPRSLDEKRFADSDVTIGSMIPDPSALAAFDYIFEEAL